MSPGIRRGVRRPVVSAAVLLALYVVLSFTCSLRGSLGTDTGAKVATLRTMEERGTWVPEVGYWADAEDPDASVHPLVYTRLVDDHFVQATTLPMVLLAFPLFRLGGYRLALLLPMAGAIACAFAARALARRLGARSPDVAFWAVGVTAPVVVYALDLWEHTAGVALVLFGVVSLIDATSEERSWRHVLLAGLLFGAAATMRTEALVYGGVTVLVFLFDALRSTRRLPPVLARGAAAFVGVAVPLLANDLLERLVLGQSLRASRAAGTASQSGLELATRMREGIETTVGVNYSSLWLDRVVGVGTLALLVFASLVVWHGWERRYAFEAFGGAAALLGARVLSGAAYIPGFVPAFPLAALGIALAWRSRRHALVAVVALAALPVVWMTQFLGGALPQWGGRYVLTSSLLLGVVGVVAALEVAPWLARGTLALSLVITGLGVTYLSQRSHDVEETFRGVAARTEDVVISRDSHYFREAGGFYYGGAHRLTAIHDDDLAEAVAVAEATGAETLAVLEVAGSDQDPCLDGWRVVDEDSFPYFYVTLRILSYARDPHASIGGIMCPLSTHLP